MSSRDQAKPLTCVFLGYLWRIAEALHAAPGVDLLAAGIEPQRSLSRRAQDVFEANGIPWFDASQIRSHRNFAGFLEGGVDLLVVGAFGQILSPQILSEVRIGSLNLHTSFLPDYRGGTPIENQILAGDSSGGITFLWMDGEVDAGPIVAQSRIKLSPDHDSYDAVFERYHRAAGELARELLKTVPEEWPRREQTGAAILHPPVKRDRFLVDWREDALTIRRKVLACGWREWVRCPLEDGDLVLVEVESVSGRFAQPGEVIMAGESPLIGTGEGVLRLREWKSPRAVIAGEVLSGGLK